MFEALNAERIRAGMTPVAWSPELAIAAVRHNADMVSRGFMDHTGSDGSSPQQRAARVGYAAPSASAWLVIEAISARPTFEAALGWLLGDGVHRRVLLRPAWREVGIAYAVGGPYGQLWTLDFGCRPNVLPVFGDISPDGQGLTLTFTNEDCAIHGGGPEQMGRAVELAVSTNPDVREAAWEPFVASKTMVRPRDHELAVRLRDARGRLSAPAYLTLDALAGGSSPTTPPTPTPTATPATRPTKEPTSTLTATSTPPSARATPAPTVTPTPEPPPTEPAEAEE